MFTGYTKVIHKFAINDNNHNKCQVIRLEKIKIPDIFKVKSDFAQDIKVGF